MTMKTKRKLAIGGGTTFCIVLAMLITARFAPNGENAPPSVSESDSDTEIRVEAPKINSEIKPEFNPEISEPIVIKTPEINSENDSELIKVEQNFPEPEKENLPPKPPEIEDEEMLTNPDQEPIYEPEQTKITNAENPENPDNNSPKHGDKKDGQIYINGFGWVVDEGGGGVCESAPDMYENGNKMLLRITANALSKSRTF